MAQEGEKQSACRVLIGKDHLEYLSTDGRII